MDAKDPPLEPSPDPAAMRDALLEERRRALAELGETVQAPSQMTYGSQAAAASEVFAQQRDLALHDRSQGQLDLIDAALARLDAGTYGVCLRCGSAIAPRRLEALPWAAHCIACQALVDRERR